MVKLPKDILQPMLAAHQGAEHGPVASADTAERP
jgi:hypothetical protein